MQHRHLINVDYSLASIDDIISRGLWQDWVDLYKQAKVNDLILGRIEHICRHHIVDPYAQRYFFWLNYVKSCQKRS